MPITLIAFRIATWTATAGLLAAGVGLASADSVPPPKTGTATSTISLPSLTLTLPDGSMKTVDLGNLVALARSDSGRLASLGLTGGYVVGSALPGWTVDSAAGPKNGDHSVPIQAAGATGSLGLLGYLVSSTDSAVTAQLGALAGKLGIGALGASASLGEHGVQTVSDATHSAASLGATVDGLTLTLGDLLPANVLDGLPLGTVTDLLTRLGVPVPTDVTALLTQLTQISGLLDQVTAQLPQLQSVQSTLDGLLAADPALAPAQQLVASATVLVTTKQSALDSATSQLTLASSALSSLQSTAAPLQAAVTAAQQQLDTATATVTSLTSQITGLQSQLAGLNSILDALQITDLTNQITALQAQLTQAQATQAADANALSQAQAVLAPVQQQLTAATAAVTTAQSVVAAAQQALDAAKAQLSQAQQDLDALIAQISNNPALTAARGLVTTLTSTVDGLLSQIGALVPGLPDVSSLTGTLLGLLKNAPLVDLGHLALGVTSTADGSGGTGSTTCTAGSITVLGKSITAPTCADLTKAFASITSKLSGVLGVLPASAVPAVTLDGLTQSLTHSSSGDAKATSAISPLHLAVPSVTLSDVTGDVVAKILSGVRQVQQAGSLVPLVTSSGLMTAHALPVVVDSALTQLTQQLSGLPTGDALAGLRTLGIDLSLVGLQANSLYHPATAIPPATAPAQQPPTQATSSGQPPVASPTHGGTPVTVSIPGSGAPGTVSSPGRSAPGTTSATGSLPFTGLDTTVLVALALVLGLAGVHLEILGRRRTAAG